MTALLFNKHNDLKIEHCNKSSFSIWMKILRTKRIMNKLLVNLSVYFWVNKMLIGDNIVHVQSNYIVIFPTNRQILLYIITKCSFQNKIPVINQNTTSIVKVALHVFRNLFVSLQLRVQNWMTKWHFPLNFQTAVYPELLLKGPSFHVTE